MKLFSVSCFSFYHFSFHHNFLLFFYFICHVVDSSFFLGSSFGVTIDVFLGGRGGNISFFAATLCHLQKILSLCWLYLFVTSARYNLSLFDHLTTTKKKREKLLLFWTRVIFQKRSAKKNWENGGREKKPLKN